MAEIEVFTRPGCMYCEEARDLLHERRLPFRERDISQQDVLTELRERLRGTEDMPQVFIGGEHIGGLDALRRRLGETGG